MGNSKIEKPAFRLDELQRITVYCILIQECEDMIEKIKQHERTCVCDQSVSQYGNGPEKLSDFFAHPYKTRFTIFPKKLKLHHLIELNNLATENPNWDDEKYPELHSWVNKKNSLEKCLIKAIERHQFKVFTISVVGATLFIRELIKAIVKK